MFVKLFKLWVGATVILDSALASSPLSLTKEQQQIADHISLKCITLTPEIQPSCTLTTHTIYSLFEESAATKSAHTVNLTFDDIDVLEDSGHEKNKIVTLRKKDGTENDIYMTYHTPDEIITVTTPDPSIKKFTKPTTICTGGNINFFENLTKVIKNKIWATASCPESAGFWAKYRVF